MADRDSPAVLRNLDLVGGLPHPTYEKSNCPFKAAEQPVHEVWRHDLACNWEDAG
jgi:hypothetical protein